MTHSMLRFGQPSCVRSLACMCRQACVHGLGPSRSFVHTVKSAWSSLWKSSTLRQASWTLLRPCITYADHMCSHQPKVNIYQRLEGGESLT